MKLETDMVLTLLQPMFRKGDSIHCDGRRHTVESIATRICLGLNDILARHGEMKILKAKQAALDTEYVTNTGEIEADMVAIQKECPHSKATKTGLFDPTENVITVYVCDICGMILDGKYSP